MYARQGKAAEKTRHRHQATLQPKRKFQTKLKFQNLTLATTATVGSSSFNPIFIPNFQANRACHTQPHSHTQIHTARKPTQPHTDTHCPQQPTQRHTDTRSHTKPHTATHRHTTTHRHTQPYTATHIPQQPTQPRTGTHVHTHTHTLMQMPSFLFISRTCNGLDISAKPLDFKSN